MPPTPHLPDDKPAARRELRARRAARRAATGPDERAAQAAAITGHLAPVLDRLPAGARVASFASLPSEPPTDHLNPDVRRRGLDLLLPLLLPDKDLDWQRAPGGEAGAAEPLGVDAVAAAALVVLPALAVDRTGMRLGQGGGSYDRALARVPAGTPLVAVVHDDELVGSVPADPHDRAVDAVVTPAYGLIVLRPGPGADVLRR